jgi:TPR repeat protein
MAAKNHSQTNTSKLSLLFVILVVFSFSEVCKATSVSIEELLNKAESGDPNSQLVLAQKYFDGRRGIPQDYNEAAKWFRKAAEQGLADAQNNLGKMYYNGHGVPQDYNEAVNWFTKAAIQDYAKAQNNLGLMYYKGEGVPQDYKEAIKWFIKAAAQGFVKAQFILGLMYSEGIRVPQNYNEAAKWFTKAATQGYAKAQFSLGVMYDLGQGVPQNYNEAAKWYTKAAAQGHTDAQFNLGVTYSKGEGVPQNYTVAAKWFTKAAAQGVVEAQFILGLMYSEGEGVLKDYVESYKWFLLAEMNGDRDAKKFKESLRDKMTSNQTEEAQQRVNMLKKVKGFLAERKVEKDSEEDKQIVQNIVKGSPAISATGFLITSDGFILTACHAVEEATRIEVLYNQKQYAAKVIRKDTLTDVAVLKIEDNNLPFLPIVSSSTVKIGDAVFTIGYPRITLQGSEPKFTEGSISSLSGLANDSKCFQISIPIQPGNSGGPLVNEKGEVIGIIVSSLNDVAILLITGSVPQNVNYALKSSFVLSFMESMPDLSKKIIIPNSVKDRTAAIEKTGKSIVVILGYE